MDYRTLTLERDGRTLYVQLSNPPLNLMTIQMVQELFDLAGKLAFDPETRVVVLRSANPEFFVAHFDLNDMFRAMQDPAVPKSAYPDINIMQALGTMWQTLPQTTIAVVDGIVRGGGLELILAFDMRFATADSKFCFPEVSGGFLPTGGGTTRLLMQVGPARAKEILLSARDFSGAEAERYGFVNRVLPADELSAYVDDLVSRVAARSAGSVGAINDVLKTIFEAAVDMQFAGFAVEEAAMRQLLSLPDVQQFLTGLAALQDIEHERDLPASLAQAAASAASADATA
jgi:enoyl-CoA hydratase/carnithine racemase